MHTTGTSTHTRGRLALLLAALLALTLVVAMPTTPAGAGGHREFADVLTQDESGVYAPNGARLTRQDHALKVRWRIRTPRPGTYLYPTPDQIPPDAPPHPPIEPGRPEVFTLWAFVFNHPELCTDPGCDFDDIGDTPAQGGIYQLDGTVARHRRMWMLGKVRLGEAPELGAALSNPMGADVHVAMTSHGHAHEGADLARQLNGAVGGPPNWWVALFEQH